MSENELEYVQFGATLGTEGLDEEVTEEIIEKISETDLRIGRAPGEGQYTINTSNDE